VVARLSAAALVTLLAALAGTAAAAPREPLGHSGRWITDADGRVVIFHGAAVTPDGFAKPFETAEEAGFGEADASFLAAQGFNLVRLGAFYGGYERQPGEFTEAYIDSFARTQRLLADRGIFTLLDFHQDMLNPRYQGRGFPDWFVRDDGFPNQPQAGFPGNYFLNPALNRAYDNLWANVPAPDGAGLQDHFAEGWRRVAARFAGAPLIAGYDLLNEPWPGSAWPTCANPEGCPPGGFDQTALTAFHERVIAGVRRGDPHRTAYYEPNLQFDVGARTGHGKVSDPNAGMSFHNYCLGAAPGLPHAPDPTEICKDQGERRVFQNAEDHSASVGGVPLLLTEFGDVHEARIHERVTDLADEFMVGWTVWGWFRAAGQIKIDPAKPPTPDNLHQDVLAAVVRPFPRVIAGTPESYSYDRESKRFRARWTTTLPGGAPAGDAVSEVFVPPLHYGAGFRVAVTGGEQVGSGAQLVVVRACRGAAAVSVEVTDAAPAAALTCPERGAGAGGGGPGGPAAPGGSRVACPRGNSPTVRCSRTTLATGEAALQVVGTRRSELLVGSRGKDVIVCGAGNDRAVGRAGADIIRCGPGADRISAGDGADRAYGGSGADRIRAGEGRDRAYGGPGADLVAGGAGPDLLSGGSGLDRFSGGPHGDRLSARDGRRELLRCGTGRDRVVADRRDRLARDCE
jgi:endoglycosylceramidase